MDTKILSLILLFGRIASVVFISMTIRLQVKLIRSRRHNELNGLRKVLLASSCLILLGNVVPIIIDVNGIFGRGSFALLITYVLSNNITALLSAMLMWQIYRVSGKVQ